MNTNPDSAKQRRSRPSSFFFLEFAPNPMPRNAIPPMGRNMAYKSPERWNGDDFSDLEDATVVLTVSVDLPPEIAPNAQVGAGVDAGVMLLQESFTLATLKKPPFGVRVTVDVADPPAVTEDGDRAEAESEKLPKAAVTA
jgi:hypothetical protein